MHAWSVQPIGILVSETNKSSRWHSLAYTAAVLAFPTWVEGSAVGQVSQRGGAPGKLVGHVFSYVVFLTKHIIASYSSQISNYTQQKFRFGVGQ